MKFLVLTAALLLPMAVFAETTKIDELMVEYQQRGVVKTETDPQAEIRRLKNEIIDLRVERDALQGQVRFLEQESSAKVIKADSVNCVKKNCVSLEDVQKERIVTHIVYSLSLYRLAEALDKSASKMDVEAHKKAQRVMERAIKDLELLGFDTKDPSNFPTVDELMRQLDTQAIGANRR